jgi:hypothetical protein
MFLEFDSQGALRVLAMTLLKDRVVVQSKSNLTLKIFWKSHERHNYNLHQLEIRIQKFVTTRTRSCLLSIFLAT